MMTEKSHAQKKRYLIELDAAATEDDVERMLKLREDFLSTDNETVPKVRIPRAELTRQLHSISWNFWNVSPKVSQRKLNRIEQTELERFPQLQLQHQQLMKATELADLMEEFESEPQVTDDFLEWVRDLLIATPAEANIMRINFLYDQTVSIETKMNYQRAAKLLTPRLPDAFSSEKKLLQSIADASLWQTNTGGSRDSTTSETHTVPGWVYFLLILLFVRIILTILRS